jgi:hypothetical protein
MPSPCNQVKIALRGRLTAFASEAHAPPVSIEGCGMVEFYKEVARFRADVRNERSGDMIDYRAVVLAGPRDGMFYIEHSHVLQPRQESGFWYSDSQTTASSAEEAEVKVRDWAKMLVTAYAVKPW